MKLMTSGRLKFGFFATLFMLSPQILWAQSPEADVLNELANPAAEAAESNGPAVPEGRRSLLSGARDSDYTMPLSYDPDQAGLLLPEPEIEYDLTGENGRELRLGQLVFNEKTFHFSLQTISQFNPTLGRQVGARGATPVLFMRWPQELMSTGTLEMISRTGTVLWSHKITERDLNNWKKQLESWRDTLRREGATEESLKEGLFATNVAIEKLKELKAPLWSQKETFRFCLTSGEDGKGHTRICTRRYGLQTKGNVVSLASLPFSSKARVVVMNQNGPMKGVVPVRQDAVAQFYADLTGGENIEFITKPPKLNLVDLSDTNRAGLLRVSGFGLRPFDNHVILNPDQFSRLTILLGFEPTIGDTRKFWAAALRVHDPKLYFPGETGGVFRQRFHLADIPRAAARPHFHRHTMKGTYSKNPWILGKKLPNSKIASQEVEIREVDGDPSLFYWKLSAPNKGQLNRSYLTVTTEDNKSNTGFFEVHRGYSTEISGRTSGIASKEGFLVIGELAFNHWFENLLWWDNYWLTKQRWGFSAKTFKSLNKLPVGTDKKANLDVTNVDIKYRLTPGLWTLDESVGLMLSYQDVTFGEIKAPMMGVGGFWARSMPRSLNTLFNYLPFMNYPKWVDMEFIYFVNPLGSDIRLHNTMALNFHGQVLWRENIFGEAGFGFKRYGITDLNVHQRALLNTIYGTIGMGIKF